MNRQGAGDLQPGAKWVRSELQRSDDGTSFTPVRRFNVSDVRTISENGRPSTVENPWPGHAVRVVRNGTHAETKTGGRFTLKTSANETITIKLE